MKDSTKYLICIENSLCKLRWSECVARCQTNRPPSSHPVAKNFPFLQIVTVMTALKNLTPALQLNFHQTHSPTDSQADNMSIMIKLSSKCTGWSYLFPFLHVDWQFSPDPYWAVPRASHHDTTFNIRPTKTKARNRILMGNNFVQNTAKLNIINNAVTNTIKIITSIKMLTISSKYYKIWL